MAIPENPIVVTPVTPAAGAFGPMGKAAWNGGMQVDRYAASIGYLEIPSNPQSADYTTVEADSGCSVDHPATDNNARTFTIDSNANVPYAIGTVITFTNMANTLTIAITSDTMYLAGSGATGSRTLAQYGIATARKVSATVWLISGAGLS